MLIGIDMLSVQASKNGDDEAGRFGRTLVETLLARNPGHQFLLYMHPGLPAPSSTRSPFASIGTVEAVPGVGPSRHRASIQQLIDRNPDDLDWLVLLDPMSRYYGNVPPENSLGELKLAGIVRDVPSAVDCGLAPLRRYDALFAVSRAAASAYRDRLGSGASVVVPVNLACDPSFRPPDLADSLAHAARNSLGSLGVDGAFLFHNTSNLPSAGLDILVEAYASLPFEHRLRHQLVIAGEVDDPTGLRSILYRRGCVDGLVLVGEVGDQSLRDLYGRCSAYLSHGSEGGSVLPLAEAMRSGAAVIAGRTASSLEIVGDAGVIVEPGDPLDFASELAELLSDPEVEAGYRSRAIERARQRRWEPIADIVLGTVSGPDNPEFDRARTAIGHRAAGSARGDSTELEIGSTAGSRGSVRFDGSHGQIRPRIAVFLPAMSTASEIEASTASVPPSWLDQFNIDYYFPSDRAGLADALPMDFGGFDARLFDRNDNLIGYHAVVYRTNSPADLAPGVDLIRRRPGLVLCGEGYFDGKGDSPKGLSILAIREAIQAGSIIAVRTARDLDVLVDSFGSRDGQIFLIPTDGPGSARRSPERNRLDLPSDADAVVIVQFADQAGSADRLLSPSAFKAIRNTVPEAMLITVGHTDADERSSLRQKAERLGLSDRYLLSGPIDRHQIDDVLAMADLAIHPGGPMLVEVADLLRVGVPTVATDCDWPDGVAVGFPEAEGSRALARVVRDLAADSDRRERLSRSALDYFWGTPDPEVASEALGLLVHHSAEVAPRSAARKANRAGRTDRGLMLSPHFPRPASSKSKRLASTGRGDA